MSRISKFAVVAGLGLVLAGVFKSAPAVHGVISDVRFGKAWTVREVYALAGEICARHLPAVDPFMLAAIAMIESGDVETGAGGRPGAYRSEPHIGDVSIGMMQTLYGTARWLNQDMGYSAYPLVAADDLLDAQTSMYFGAAYVNHLRRFRGTAQSEQFVIESYNGGPGNSNSGTRAYWEKYLRAQERVATELRFSPGV